MRTRWMAPAVLVGLTFVAYAGSLGNGWVWDDFLVLVDNPALRDLTRIGDFFTDYRTGVAAEGMAFYRPLRTLLYALMIRGFGVDPIPFHALNVILHAGNTLLVFILCRMLSGRVGPAWTVAAIFALHPIQTEAVASVTGLTDVLFAAFCLMALLAHLKQAGRSVVSVGWALTAYALFVGGLLSKEMAVVLPLLIFLLDAWRGSDRKVAPLPRGTVLYVGGFFALAGAFVLLRSGLLGGAAAGSWEGVTFGRTMVMQITVVERYLQLLVFPVGQSIRHVIPIPEPEVAASVARAMTVVGGVVLVGALYVRRDWNVAFGIAWFFVALLPVMNIVPLRGAMMGERFLYLPMIGLAYAAVHLTLPVWGWLHDSGRSAVSWGVIGVLLASLSMATVRRTALWKDNVTIFEAAVGVSPTSNALRIVLIREYERLGLKDLREEHLRAGADNTRRYLALYLRFAARAEAAGSLEEAAEWYRRALRMDPSNAIATDRLGALSEEGVRR
ncbi:MAG TPA: hypothetical protein VLA36_11035 [Longimicrobiales bacterium]|nr:hypothetical protein [Longimicrobiales bacterium]